MKILLQAAAAAAALCMVAAPAYAQNVNTGRTGTHGRVQLTAGFTPDPHSLEVTAGGPVEASSVGDTCVGFLPQRASYTLQYRASEEWQLYISASSEGDAVIAVRAPNGEWRCDDDSAGRLNPGVTFEAPRSGRYQIWVGTYGEAAAMPATLYISEVGYGNLTERPDWSLDPAYGETELAAGFMPDPAMVEIAAGGTIDASLLGVPGCVGWIARAPDYRVQWAAGSGELPLIFSVASEADTTLVINDPNDNWVCNDDGGEGLNPSIRFVAPQSGQYDIWVGTYMQGETQPSTLHISELTSQ